MIIKTLAGTLVAAAALAAEQPNVLFITVDDLKPMLGCYGDETIQTPNIDRLAARGTVFLNNYCQQAVCAPSRMSMFTGLRPDTTGVTDLKTDLRVHLPDAKTMQQVFKEHGYETLGCGKVMHGSRNEDPPSWSVPFMHDEHLTYADGWPVPADLQYQGKTVNDAFAQVESEGVKGWKKRKDRLVELNARPPFECIDVPDDAYADGAMAVWAAGQIEELSKHRKPFFVTVGFHKPHLPFVAPKKYWDLYDRSQFQPAPVQHEPEGAPGYAGHTWGELRSYSGIPSEGPLPLDRHAELIHAYHACVSYTDAQIGRLLDALDQSGAADNTVIILWGDHGWHLGDHGWWCKHTNYEQATKAPLIISAPGYDSAEAQTMSEFVDVYPTLCELTGIPAPEGLQGKSLVPALKDPASAIKDYSISQFPRGKIMGYALRTPRYRYVEWIKNGAVQNIELYDYQADPFETASLHQNPEYRDILRDLKTKMAEFLEKN
ncbi:sulfatase [Tichowtungia aerotolerans]|uniref:Sulfatase-like hydrolase/transferase n=1 Tax=Tichowtungia aerotolerans TaxID=2697043 RepID=A0A6P1MDB5_9BACT|nr:sulfatase [Tichowtungia aerotolerans]QHI69095.1 sulfatase-like hydrolase/transferase [Tichowtungia aerotolerans]